jgi:hypothetical protein
MGRKMEEVKKEAISKLRKGMLMWQLATTGQFAFFFLLMEHWGVMGVLEHVIVFLGAYLFFTGIHIMYFILWYLVFSNLEEKK